MKITEENLLKDTILKINNYVQKYNLNGDFYNHLQELELNSLQNFSFQKDIEFFEQISFVLSVIISIINHPHISNKREEIIIRSEQAGHLTTENFQSTLRNPSLWKEKKQQMVPEYVHHYQYSDELNIYENRFIILLIDIIEEKINEYINFYTTLIPSLDSIKDTSISENEDVSTALNTLNNFLRKLMHIKDTFFYKEISKNPPISKQIKPTNILLKDRLYNYCYKFYCDFIKYDKELDAKKDFCKYYYFLLLKEFNKRGFKIAKQVTNINKLSFSTANFNIDLTCDDISKITFMISIKNQDAKYQHNLYVEPKRTITLDNNTDYALTKYAITIWNLLDLENNQEQFTNPKKEQEMITFLIDKLLYQVDAKKDIYIKHCPKCKKNNLEENSFVYTCRSCHTIYTFIGEKGKEKIWFIKIGG